MSYRILSLDGGGSWALIEIKALMALYGEDAAGHDVLAEFDMVAANSGGSIVLGGLVENLTLRQILHLFEDEKRRRAIFSPTKHWLQHILHKIAGLGPKYSAANKFPALAYNMPRTGNLPLSQAISGAGRAGTGSDAHLLIIGFDYDRNRACFFRSSKTGGGTRWGDGSASGATLCEAIHASTNAPVNYFDAPAHISDGRYWDGGISGCNNPVLAAVTEAICKDVAPTEIRALSLGTATVALPWPQEGEAASPYLQSRVSPRLDRDLRKLATAIVDDPPDVATFLAHVMTGGSDGISPLSRSRIVRMNPLISPVGGIGAWKAPGTMTAEAFHYLADLDMDAVEQRQVEAIGSYAELWLRDDAPNQPLRMNQDTLEPELGQMRFSDAKSAWEAIR